MIDALPEVRGDDGVEDGAVQSERLVDRFAQQSLARRPGIGEPCLGSGGLPQIGRRRPAWPQGLRVAGDLADQQGGEQAAGGFPGSVEAEPVERDRFNEVIDVLVCRVEEVEHAAVTQVVAVEGGEDEPDR